MKRNVLGWITAILVIVGALNWGLISINEGWNVVSLIFGSVPYAERVIYALVGLAGLWELVMLFK